MNHVVYLDAKEKELDKLRNGQKHDYPWRCGENCPTARSPGDVYGSSKTTAKGRCDAVPR